LGRGAPMPPPRPKRRAAGRVAPRRPRSGSPLCPLGGTDSPGAATPVDSGAPLGAGSSSVASRASGADVSDRSGATPSALSGLVSVVRAAKVCSGPRRTEASGSAGSKACPSPCVCSASPADPAPAPDSTSENSVWGGPERPETQPEAADAGAERTWSASSADSVSQEGRDSSGCASPGGVSGVPMPTEANGSGNTARGTSVRSGPPGR